MFYHLQKIFFIITFVAVSSYDNIKAIREEKDFKQQDNNMRHVTVYTTEQGYGHFIKLAENLHYIKKIETNKVSGGSVLDNVRAGLEEVRLFKDGKLKTTPAKDFLNEL